MAHAKLMSTNCLNVPGKDNVLTLIFKKKNCNQFLINYYLTICSPICFRSYQPPWSIHWRRSSMGGWAPYVSSMGMLRSSIKKMKFFPSGGPKTPFRLVHTTVMVNEYDKYFIENISSNMFSSERCVLNQTNHSQLHSEVFFFVSNSFAKGTVKQTSCPACCRRSPASGWLRCGRRTRGSG